MKLLVLSSRFPFPLEKGDKLRLYHQLRELAKQHEICLISLTEREVSEAELAELQPFCQQIHLFRLSKLGIYTSLLKALFTQKAFQQAYFFRPHIARQVALIAADFQPDMIYCQLVRMAGYCEALPFPVTLDYMDALSLGMARRAKHSSPFIRPVIAREAHLLLSYERSLLDVFEYHTIISAGDAAEIEDKEQSRIQVITNGVDTDFFFPRKRKASYELVFVGNMGYFPNVQAALFLGKEILARMPQPTKLLLAGARPSAQVQALASQQIKISGWVDDIRDAYSDGRIFVAPLFTGSGQQNKILEAMAMGIPCVTTTIVNGAIGAASEEEILIANSADEFVSQITRLQQDTALYDKLAEAGRKFVEEMYSWQAAVAELSKIWA